MNALRNKVQLIGNLGMNPEIKSFDGGKKLAKFSIATNEVYYNAKGEKQEETQWHNVEVWGKAGETVARFKAKGDWLFVAGPLKYNEYEKDGQKKFWTYINAKEFELGPKVSGSGGGATTGSTDDVPF